MNRAAFDMLLNKAAFGMLLSMWYCKKADLEFYNNLEA